MKLALKLLIRLHVLEELQKGTTLPVIVSLF